MALKVGLIYAPVYLEHDTGNHVENASRLVETMKLLDREGVLKQLTQLKPRAASVEELMLVHTQKHVSLIQSTAEKGGGWLDADTVTSSASYHVALYAAGGAIEGVEAVLRGDMGSAFALVRPPGHHATSTNAMGFCLFNNIAVAARVAINSWHLERILIVDFDVHHGNGTQEAFYTDPRVLYFSTHEYPFYPGSGSVEEIGEGAGEGTTVNVPLPAGCGDEEYRRVFQEILVPVARRYQPQLILVSAGYDPHWADSLAMMRVSVTGFAEQVVVIRHLAEELCQGKLAFALEGGYHLRALATSVRATLDVLLGKKEIVDPLGPPREGARAPSIDALLARVKAIHKL